MTHLVDVLIPVFNGEKFLQASIRSIQSQTLSDIIIHIVDDGSTDSTPEILADIAHGDPRIKIYSKCNGGIVDALNFGLTHCNAEFLARHDADDLAYPSRLAQQLAVLQQRPELVAVGGYARHIDSAGRFTGTTATFASPDLADPNYVPAREPYLLHPFLMVRRQALLSIGGYRFVTHAEDADLYWRLQERGVLYNDPCVQGDYRMHDNSVSSISANNGRVMAVSSQLCAISAVRRRAGSQDLEFLRKTGVELSGASSSLTALVDIVSAPLTVEELGHFKFAVGMKLLEMAVYRPYEVSLEDCLFVKGALRGQLERLTKENRPVVVRILSGTAARLVSAGHWRSGAALLKVEWILPFLLRVLLRIVLTERVHKKLNLMATPLLRRLRRA